MNNIVILITNAEQIKGLRTLKKFCKEVGYKVTPIKMDDNNYLSVQQLTANRSSEVVKKLLKRSCLNDYDALIIPSNYPNIQEELESEVKKIIKNFVEMGKPVLPLSKSPHLLQRVLH